jgi:hypothetical protein
MSKHCAAAIRAGQVPTTSSISDRFFNKMPASDQHAHSDDRDQLFRSIATSAARVLVAPLDDGGDVNLLRVGQARR